MIEDQKHWSQILLYRISNRTIVSKYQLLLFINFAFKWILAGMILFSLNFFYITPQFQCSVDQPLNDKSCQQYICSLDQNQWYQHLKKPIPKSIALDYGIIMLCGNQWLSSTLQSLSYIGSFVGYFVMSHIADNLGRRKTEMASWFINIAGLVLLVSSFNLYMVGIGSFLMGLGTNAAITLHYTFLKQLLIGKLRERSYILLQIAFSIGLSFIALASWFIMDWKLVAGLLILLPCLLIIPFNLWIIQQTPNFSLKKSKLTLLDSLNRIARINQQDYLTIQDLQFLPQQQMHRQTKINQYSLIDLFRYKSLRQMTIICGIINLVIQFIYDGTILSLDKIGVNVYLDQILVGFVQIFAAIFCSWIVVRTKRNKFLKICFILIGCFTFLIGVLTLLFQHKNNQINFHVIAEMILLACLRFVLNSTWGLFFVYVAELYPSNVLSITFGWVSGVGTIGAFSAPFIRLVTANTTMFFMSGLCVVSVLLLIRLRETKGQKSTHQIQQRQEQNKKSIQTDNQVN